MAFQLHQLIVNSPHSQNTKAQLNSRVRVIIAQQMMTFINLNLLAGIEIGQRRVLEMSDGLAEMSHGQLEIIHRGIIGFQLGSVTRLDSGHFFGQVSGVPVGVQRQNDRLQQIAGHLGPQLGDGPMVKESDVHNVGQQMVGLVQGMLH